MGRHAGSKGSGTFATGLKAPERGSPDPFAFRRAQRVAVRELPPKRRDSGRRPPQLKPSGLCGFEVHRKLDSQIVGNSGLYFTCYRLSLLRWSAVPAARNARAIDIVAYSRDGKQYPGIQVSSLRERAPLPPGTSTEHRMGDFWAIIDKLSSEWTASILTPHEVKRRGRRGGKMAGFRPGFSPVPTKPTSSAKLGIGSHEATPRHNKLPQPSGFLSGRAAGHYPRSRRRGQYRASLTNSVTVSPPVSAVRFSSSGARCTCRRRSRSARARPRPPARPRRRLSP